jgi:hypothetical protein
MKQLFKITKTKQPVYWTKDEDAILLYHTSKQARRKRWSVLTKYLPNKNPYQCYLRHRAISPHIKRGAWSKEEDHELLTAFKLYGRNWKLISRKLRARNSKQIRDRYTNHLDPRLNRSRFTPYDDLMLIELHEKYGNRWSVISNKLNRPYDQVKNRFNASLKKNLEYYKAISSFDKKSECDTVNTNGKLSSEEPDMVNIFDLGSWGMN